MKSRHLLAVLALPLLLTGCVSSSDIQALQSQLADIQRQVLQLQKQGASKNEISNLNDRIAAESKALLKSEADLEVGMQNVAGKIDQLQSHLEDTNYRLAQLSQQIATTNQELKSTHGATNGNGAESNGGTDQGGQPPMVPTDPQTLYQTAYNDYLRGNYDLAILGFRQYLDSFPTTDLADNAAYWIGECYFSEGKYEQAIQEFDALLKKYPASDKMASALLKKGYSLLELGQKDQAVDQLKAVISQFPRSDEANLAKQRLKAIGVDQ